MSILGGMWGLTVRIKLAWSSRDNCKSIKSEFQTLQILQHEHPNGRVHEQQAREISPEKSTTINLDWIPSVLRRQHQIVDII